MPKAIVATPKASLAEAVFQHGERSFREPTLYLPNALAQTLTLYCREHNVDINALVADTMSKYMEQTDHAVPSAGKSRWTCCYERCAAS